MVIAVDTNVIVRLAMRDDEEQYQKVIALLKEQQFYISRTVQLEIEWVLRSRYKRSITEIADFMTLLLQKNKLICENEQALMNAICCYRLGADFADALHLTNTENIAFYTFDQRFCKQGIVSKVIII